MVFSINTVFSIFLTSKDGAAEVDVIKEQSSIVVVPYDDCQIQVVWSVEYHRLIAVISEIPHK